ncbi:TadE/TadG family type IV pilus assembly protein [Arthrobacter sp. ISL-30]|uniref:TadE/TadG family type IV pilus assembly protein n=1 Tax=Arthrobacter sp. ISL-30 TaxID=2819109 RepID=UPI001BE682F1|nr:TadE/TadG family type IV pilus assembly protein [Arthrobacter sp. ISL-30]MBT2514385.1 Tad domain-containing protein [Arthrobacter sp. ISL-30]
MRRLRADHGSELPGSEHGGIAVIVALLMVVLLAFGAIAVDVGTLYAERAQLRNSADSAALAMAQKCAKNTNDVDCSTSSALARSFANGNANDGLSNIKSISLDKTNRSVSVTAGAQEAGRTPNEVSLFFARAMGIGTSEVTAPSTVRWGSPLAGRTAFPLTFSICQVKDNIGGSLQLLQDHGLNQNADCMYGPSGAAVAGGFGWLVQDPGVCGGTIDLSINEGGSDPGNNAPGNCSTILQKWADEINAGRDVTVLLPIFDAVSGTGNGASYHMISFAAFKVKGWKFSGGSDLPYTFQNKAPHVSSALTCDGNCRGIIGSFVKYTSLADGYSLGPVDPYGATIVRLSN